MLAFDRSVCGLQQQLFVGCAWMAAGAVGARLCSTVAVPAPAVGAATSIRDHDLLRCASLFLLARTGRSPSRAEPFHVELASVLAVDVQAYGASGRLQVLDVLIARASSFHTGVVSVTAVAADASVRVNYNDGSDETMWCCRGPAQQVLIQQVQAGHQPPHHETTCVNTVDSVSDPSGSVDVELLWWAIRFLHADISRDYTAQRRYLATDASAFGAEGREAVLVANGEDLPEDEKTVYTVPYPITIDADTGAQMLVVSTGS